MPLALPLDIQDETVKAVYRVSVCVCVWLCVGVYRKLEEESVFVGNGRPMKAD